MRNAKPDSVETGAKSSLAALAEAANGGANSSEPAPWTLPSGEELLEYALKGGFLAPSILTPAAGDAARKGNQGKR
jgi:hypothetical protein